VIDSLPYLQSSDLPAITRNKLEILQVNLGYLCNLSCAHCHVNAGPKRTELMDKATIDQVLDFIDKHALHTLDLTGGAPEMNPHFRYWVNLAGHPVRRAEDLIALRAWQEQKRKNQPLIEHNCVDLVVPIAC